MYDKLGNFTCVNFCPFYNLCTFIISILSIIVMSSYTFCCCFLSHFSGYNTQQINVYNTQGDTLSTIKYYEGFIGQRIGPVSALAFHPYKVNQKTKKRSTVRPPVFDRHQFFGTSEHYGKPMEVYYLDEWIIITLHVAGFLHPAIF